MRGGDTCDTGQRLGAAGGDQNVGIGAAVPAAGGGPRILRVTRISHSPNKLDVTM